MYTYIKSSFCARWANIMLYVNYFSTKLGNRGREKSQWLLKLEQASFTEMNLTQSQMILWHSPKISSYESYVSYMLGRGLMDSSNTKFIWVLKFLGSRQHFSMTSGTATVSTTLMVRSWLLLLAAQDEKIRWKFPSSRLTTAQIHLPSHTGNLLQRITELYFVEFCVKKPMFFSHFLARVRELSRGCGPLSLQFRDKGVAEPQQWLMNVATVNDLLFVHFYDCWMTPFVKVQVRVTEINFGRNYGIWKLELAHLGSLSRFWGALSAGQYFQSLLDGLGKDRWKRSTAYRQLSKCPTRVCIPRFRMDVSVTMVNQMQIGHLSSDPDPQSLGPKPRFSQLHPSSRTRTPNTCHWPRLCWLWTDYVSWLPAWFLNSTSPHIPHCWVLLVSSLLCLLCKSPPVLTEGNITFILDNRNGREGIGPWPTHRVSQSQEMIQIRNQSGNSAQT